MNIVKKYIEYLKNNPENLWFKRKLYGWGWTPAKWQGWVVVLSFIGFVVLGGLDLSSVEEPTDNLIRWFFIKIIVALVLLLIICYKKGEKPRWQWGLPKDKDN